MKIKHLGSAALLVVAILGTLYVGEGAFSSVSNVPSASAWNCEWMKATPATITEGDSSKLEWKFSNDSGVTVTIDQIPNKTWQGTQGTTEVSPKETTTYVARAHKTGISKTLTCSTKVTVEKKPEPAPDPVCTLTANKTTIEKGESAKLTWTSEHAVSAVMDQGIGAIGLNDSRDVSPQATTTFKATFKNKEGKEVSCEKTINVKEKPVTPPANAPVCSMSVSASSVSKGSEVTLSWNSQYVDTATIDNSIGSVATSGSKTVTVNDATTYTGTFKGTNGTSITCAASVSITTTTGGGGGGGGPCRNCKKNNDDKKETTTTTKVVKKSSSPNIVLSSVATPAPYVYLSQVPYTGFEAGPVLTALFWLAVVALSALIAYVMTVPQPITSLMKLANKFAGVSEEKESVKLFQASALQNPFTTVPFAQADIDRAVIMADDTDTASGDTLDDVVEERAQKDHILLSPEALRALSMERERTSLEEAAFFDAVFEEAKANYPREDGWILLSKERINAVLSVVRGGQTRQKVSEAPVQAETRAPYSAAMTYSKPAAQAAPVAKAQAAPAHAQTIQEPRHSRAVDVSPAAFISMIEAGRQQEAFETLRTLTSQNKGEHFIKNVVSMLDDVYKNRIEGGRTLDADLARTTATWSNGDLQTVLGILVESVDWSYASARVGTKIALSKVFEYFESKKA